MAEKKKATKKVPPKSKGVVGRLKNILKHKPTKASGQPRKAKAKAASRTRNETAVAKKQAAPKNQPASKNQPAPKNQFTPKNQPAQNADPGQPIKRKPPSITITRPEVTRPPLVQMPVPKNEPPIGAPSILVPKGGLAVPSLTPSLRWMYVGGATRYEVEWSHDTHFGRGHGSTVVSAQTLVTIDATHALKPGVLYQWRVRGGNDSGWGPWSSTESFKAPDKA